MLTDEFIKEATKEFKRFLVLAAGRGRGAETARIRDQWAKCPKCDAVMQIRAMRAASKPRKEMPDG